MKFGFFAMPEHPPWENWTLSYDRDLDRIVHAEKMGFDEFWIGEHHTGGFENVPVPEYMIAKASALTHRIRLGTGVISMPFHDPFHVAERLAFLDHLTHGRLICGFGGGGLPSDVELFEIPPEETRPRMQEAIDIAETYLTANEPVSYDGRFWKYNKRQIQVRPFQNPIPIAIAGLTGLNSYKIAGEKGYFPLSISFTPIHTEEGEETPFDLKDQGNALDEAAKNVGRNVQDIRKEWRVVREVYVAESKEQALSDIREGAQASYDYLIHQLGLGAIMKTEDGITDDDITLEYMIEKTPWIIGSPDECIEQIQKLEEETGGFGYFLISAKDWVPDDKWYRSVELFARRVIPAFK